MHWNSSYYKVKHIIQLQQPLYAALIDIKRTDLMPTEMEISTMEIFIEVLKPVVEITEAIGSEKSVTISTIRPLLYKLLSQKPLENSPDKLLAKTLRRAMLADLKDRYRKATQQCMPVGSGMHATC